MINRTFFFPLMSCQKIKSQNTNGRCCENMKKKNAGIISASVFNFDKM